MRRTTTNIHTNDVLDQCYYPLTPLQYPIHYVSIQHHFFYVFRVWSIEVLFCNQRQGNF